MSAAGLANGEDGSRVERKMVDQRAEIAAIKHFTVAPLMPTLTVAAAQDMDKCTVVQHAPLLLTHLTAAQHLGQRSNVSARQQLPSHSDMTGAGPSQDIKACLSAEQTATQPKKKVVFFKGQSVPKIWQEWYHGGDHGSIKSTLRSNQRDGQERLGLRGAGVARSVTDELRKKRHLPEAIEDLISDKGLPEEVAVRLVDKLLSDFDLVTMASKFNAFYKRSQMKKEGESSRQNGKAAELANKKNPSMTVKAFDEAYEQAVQAARVSHLQSEN